MKKVLQWFLTCQKGALHFIHCLLVLLRPSLLLKSQLLHLRYKDIEPLHLQKLILLHLPRYLLRYAQSSLDAVLNAILGLVNALLNAAGLELEVVEGL